MQTRMDWSTLFRKYGILLILVLECILFGVLAKNFATLDNAFNVLRQTSMLGIVCIGEALVMMTGGIDLSVGTMLGISVITSGKLMESGMEPTLACMIGIFAAMAVGAINGFAVASIGIVPLIATLGTETAFRGLIYIWTNASPIFGFDESFRKLATGYVFDTIPVPAIIMIGAFVIAWFYINRTRYGRYTYAIGGNQEVARLSGIRVKRVKYTTYLISGLCAGLAGLIQLARLGSAQPRAGLDYEMDAITAVVLGGVSVAGGQGKLSGVIFGVFIMAILSNGLVMLGINEYWQTFLTGMVLLVAVGFDVTSNRRKDRFVKEAAEREATQHAVTEGQG